MSLKIEKLKEIINKRKTVIGVANDLNVSRQTVHKWLSRYKRFGEEGLVDRKRAGCKKAHNRTSVEVETSYKYCKQVLRRWSRGTP